MVKITSSNVVATSLSAGIFAVLSYFAYTTVPLIPGVQAMIFPGAAWAVVTGMWFGIWGAIGTWIGAVIASSLTGAPILTALVADIADFWHAIIPAIIFKRLVLDVELKSTKDWIAYILFGIFIPHPLGGTWAMSWQTIFGFITWPVGKAIIVSWAFNNWICVAVLATPLLKLMSKHIKRTPLFTRGLVS
jgi:hypothetical protein